jgi:mannose-1-phosphate guanylyltransferase/mannose-6-phosphate isomerase
MPGVGPQVTDCEKPWGRFEQFAHNVPCTVKVIAVNPGGILSLQYHHKRDELWVVLDEGVRVEVGEDVLLPKPGDRLFIPRGTVHRLSGVGEGSARVLEVSFGLFDEEDIVRLDDVYGRAEPAEDLARA